MRRKEKEITDKIQIEQIFKDAQVCHLGLVDGKYPYIVPMNFGYKDNVLYFHSALVGRKIDVVKKNPEVCFEIDIAGEVIDSEEACNWNMNYSSIMGDGKVVFIDDEDEKSESLDIIMEHYSGKGEWNFGGKMMAKISVFKIEIENISAKRSGDLV